METAHAETALPKERAMDNPVRLASRGWRWLTPAETAPAALLEVVLGMAVAIAAGYAIAPHDPLLLSWPFPWLWLVATLFALRYGAMLGVAAGGIIVLFWLAAYGGIDGAPWPVARFAGGTIQLILCGHFADLWRARTTRQDQVAAWMHDRLAALTHDHYLLRQSHSRLEQQILVQPFSLRDALDEIRCMAKEGDGDLPGVQPVLDFLVTACQLDEAAMFSAGDGRLDLRPAAVAGTGFDLDADQELVRQCLQQRRLVHLRQSDSRRSPYLVCVPLLTSSGMLLGVLAVKRMPFLALNEQNLQLLQVLLNYYADSAADQDLVEPVRHHVPACPHDFAVELARLARMQAAGVRSSLLAFVVPESLGELVVRQIADSRRSLDEFWQFQAGSMTLVIVLLPLTDGAGRDDCARRIGAGLEARLGTSLEHAGIVVHAADVDADEPAYGLARLKARCSRHA